MSKIWRKDFKKKLNQTNITVELSFVSMAQFDTLNELLWLAFIPLLGEVHKSVRINHPRKQSELESLSYLSMSVHVCIYAC